MVTAIGNDSSLGRVVSVNVAIPRTVAWRGRNVTTGIFKEPVPRRVTLRRLGFEGDKQADLTVHGGTNKAAYVYPAEHYDYWQGQLDGMKLPWGMFGENLTTSGLLEDAVHIGDQFRIGSARVKVTQPRMPCFKLAIKFGRTDMIKRFLASRRSGFYLSVLEEGEIGREDEVRLLHRARDRPTVTELLEPYMEE